MILLVLVEAVPLTSATVGGAPPPLAPGNGSLQGPLARSDEPPAVLAGQVSTGEPSVNPVPLARAVDQNSYLQQHEPQNASAALAFVKSPSGNLSRPVPSNRTLSQPVPYGYVTGTVVTANLPHEPVSGANVSAFPVEGFCPPMQCVPYTTGPNGTFQIAAAGGENELYVSAPYFFTNRSWVNVTDGGFVSAGTIRLIRDGFVSGILLGDDPDHEPIGGVGIVAFTRDASFQATPSAVSSPNGTFLAAIPPLASELAFSPPPLSPYQSNVTYVNGSSGQTVDIGAVYLAHLTNVTVTLVNSVTGVPVSGTSAEFVACSKISGLCGPDPAPGFSGPTIEELAPVGPDSVTVLAQGYVTNVTSLGVVPTNGVDAPPVSMGTIDMVPLGVLQMEINITGVPAPYGEDAPTSLWPLGLALVEACNLDGLTTDLPYWNDPGPFPGGASRGLSTDCVGSCVSPGQPFELPAFPLRDFISVVPDTTGVCYNGPPAWPTPPDLPVTGNWTWANVTPGRLLNVGALNLWPGTYIEGQVLPAEISDWSVSACSTDAVGYCDPPVQSDYYIEHSLDNSVAAGCPSGLGLAPNITFCVPAPPGPITILVVSANTSSNWTWGAVPTLEWTDNPLPLSVATNPSTSAILLVTDTVSGRVLQVGTDAPIVGLAGVTVCPAGNAPAASVCQTVGTDFNGDFQEGAPPGWDQVTVSAGGYEPNSTWLLVTGNNSTGTILLTPEAYIQGQVVAPDGVGLYEATVVGCPSTDPTYCQLIGGDGETSTDGQYYGPLPPGLDPLNTFQIEATAPGYQTDWTWVNLTTPGSTVNVSPIVLAPLAPATGAGGGRLGSGPASGPQAVGAWVAGQVVDAKYGVGLPGCTITAYPIDGGPSVAFTSDRGTDGEFNDSLFTGPYEVTVTEAGFYPTTLYINVTGFTDAVNLGTIHLVPFPTVTGRVVIDPGSWRRGVTFADGLGPGASISVCPSSGTLCGLGEVDSSGVFNVSAPAGTYDTVAVDPLGFGPGSVPGGFLTNQTYVNVTNASGAAGPPILIGLDIFGAITGSVSAAGSGGTEPVRFNSMSAAATTELAMYGSPGPVVGASGLNAMGAFVLFFPPSRVLNVTVLGTQAWIPVEDVGITGNETGPGGAPSYALGVAGVLNLGAAFSLEHYGWVDMQVTDSVTGLPVPYASLSANEAGFVGTTPTDFASSGAANGGGYVNITAPPSIPALQPVSLNLSGVDYLYEDFSVLVNSTETTYVSSEGVMGGVHLLPWGWIAGDVVDARTGDGLSGVAVQSFAPGFLTTGRIGIQTSATGSYLTDAPVAPNDTVVFSLGGYAPNQAVEGVAAGQFLTGPTVQLTGDATVAGQVLSLPDHLPVAGATVSGCPTNQPYCGANTLTNASGYFVLDVGVGVIGITVTGTDIQSPAPYYVSTQSEQWYWAGLFEAEAYGSVAGVALAVPGGLPLVGAEASVCVPGGTVGGGQDCIAGAPTNVNGSFFVSVPSGLYTLEIMEPFYNTTALPIVLNPGQVLPVGVVFVFEYGVGTGLVVGSSTGTPVGDANVTACEAWGSRTCTSSSTTGANGRFVVSGPSGPFELAAKAPGYETTYVRINLSSGITTTLPNVILISIGPGNRYLVSGYVVAFGPSGSPLAGVLVAASGGISTDTNASGAYSFTLAWGSYVVTASLPGYIGEAVSLTVTGPLTNLDFTLAIRTYNISGVVRDGLTNATVADVQFSQGGVPLGAVTNASGSYSLTLANGTHVLVATDLAAPTRYAALTVYVSVVGASLVRDVNLDPPAVAIDGVVSNGETGLPVAGATVTIRGPTADGPLLNLKEATSSDGRFVASAYPGTFRVNVTEPGYLSTNASISLGNASSVPLSILLTPLAAPPSSPPSTSSYWLLGGVGAAAVVLIAALLVVRRRNRPPPAEA